MSTPTKEPGMVEDATVYGSALDNLSLSTSFLSDSGKKTKNKKKLKCIFNVLFHRFVIE